MTAMHSRSASRSPDRPIIAEDETSTLVAPRWTAKLDASGYIHLTREAQQ
jgi:hypothetical protein